MRVMSDKQGLPDDLWLLRTDEEVARYLPRLFALFKALERAGDFHNGELIEPDLPWNESEVPGWLKRMRED